MDEDYGWFSPDDFEFVVSALARHPHRSRLLVVGGQSLVAWANWYYIDIPCTSTPYLTQDLDLVGLTEDARILAGLLHARLHVPALGDATPQTGKLVFRRDGGGRLIIDVLSGVIGVPDAELERLAVELDFGAGRTVRVLHPLLVLESRIHNLHVLPGKRTAEGITQASVAIRVAQRYLAELLDDTVDSDPHCRQAIKAVKRIVELACSNAGNFAFAQYGLDPMQAVEPERFASETFRSRQWPLFLRRVAEGREKALARKKGLIHLPRKMRRTEDGQK